MEHDKILPNLQKNVKDLRFVEMLELAHDDDCQTIQFKKHNNLVNTIIFTLRHLGAPISASVYSSWCSD